MVFAPVWKIKLILDFSVRVTKFFVKTLWTGMFGIFLIFVHPKIICALGQFSSWNMRVKCKNKYDHLYLLSRIRTHAIMRSLQAWGSLSIYLVKGCEASSEPESNTPLHDITFWSFSWLIVIDSIYRRLLIELQISQAQNPTVDRCCWLKFSLTKCDVSVHHHNGENCKDSNFLAVALLLSRTMCFATLDKFPCIWHKNLTVFELP